MTSEKKTDAQIAAEFKVFQKTEKELGEMLKGGRTADALETVAKMGSEDVRKLNPDLREKLISGFKQAQTNLSDSQKDYLPDEAMARTSYIYNRNDIAAYPHEIARLQKLKPTANKDESFRTLQYNQNAQVSLAPLVHGISPTPKGKFESR